MDRYEKEALKQREDHIEKQSEETMDEIRLIDEEEVCPHITTRGDCLETARPSGRIKTCLLEHGGECEEWEEIKAEWKKAVANQEEEEK